MELWAFTRPKSSRGARVAMEADTRIVEGDWKGMVPMSTPPAAAVTLNELTVKRVNRL